MLALFLAGCPSSTAPCTARLVEYCSPCDRSARRRADFALLGGTTEVFSADGEMIGASEWSTT